MKLTVDTRTISNILYFDKDCLQSGLADLVRVPFGEIDEWFEEDMRIYKHPKSPYHRVDVLESNRYIDVLLEDTMLARADTFLFLLETGRPATFYLPPDSVVDEQYLTQTMVKKGCPYKGQAWYMDVTVNGRVYRELAWKYATQTGATLRLARHICFDRDRVVFRWGQGNPPESTNWG